MTALALGPEQAALGLQVFTWLAHTAMALALGIVARRRRCPWLLPMAALVLVWPALLLLLQQVEVRMVRQMLAGQRPWLWPGQMSLGRFVSLSRAATEVAGHAIRAVAIVAVATVAVQRPRA